jgi:two-component system, OmpR family, sensor kinase
MSVVDEDALALLVNNLLDNAIKHGDATHAIQINLSADGLLQVSNQADHLDAQALERLQERFFRGTTTAKGSGLGLAIVASLVQGMHATM